MDEHQDSSEDQAEGQHESGRAGVKRVMSALYPELDVATKDADGIVSGHCYFAPEREHTGAPGWVQGGLSATVIDFVSARIAKVALESSVATGTLELRYRQPVMIDGGPYRVEGVSEKRFSRTVRVNARILGADGIPLVEGSGLFVAVTRD